MSLSLETVVCSMAYCCIPSDHNFAKGKKLFECDKTDHHQNSDSAVLSTYFLMMFSLSVLSYTVPTLMIRQ